MKARNNHRVSVLKPYLFVLVWLPIELHWNFELCCLYFIFFHNLSFQIGGVANLWVRLIHRLLRYLLLTLLTLRISYHNSIERNGIGTKDGKKILKPGGRGGDSYVTIEHNDYILQVLTSSVGHKTSKNTKSVSMGKGGTSLSFCSLPIYRIYRDRSFHCDVCNVCLDKRLEGKHKCRWVSQQDNRHICLKVMSDHVDVNSFTCTRLILVFLSTARGQGSKL